LHLRLIGTMGLVRVVREDPAAPDGDGRLYVEGVVPVPSGRVVFTVAALWMAGGWSRVSAGEMSVGIERRLLRDARRRARCVANA
jgi:hypothetical protein